MVDNNIDRLQPPQKNTPPAPAPERTMNRNRFLKILGAGIGGSAFFAVPNPIRDFLGRIANGDADPQPTGPTTGTVIEVGQTASTPVSIAEGSKSVAEKVTDQTGELNNLIAIEDQGKRQDAERNAIEEASKSKDSARLSRLLDIAMDRQTRTQAVEALSKLVTLTPEHQSFCRDWGINFATMDATLRAHKRLLDICAKANVPPNRVPNPGMLAMIVETETSGGVNFGQSRSDDGTSWDQKDKDIMSVYLQDLQKKTGINYTKMASFPTSYTGAIGIQFQPTTLSEAQPQGETTMNPFDIFDKGDAVVMAGWYLAHQRGPSDFYWDENDPDDIPPEALNAKPNEVVTPEAKKTGKYPALFGKWNHDGNQLVKIIHAENAYQKIAG